MLAGQRQELAPKCAFFRHAQISAVACGLPPSKISHGPVAEVQHCARDCLTESRHLLKPLDISVCTFPAGRPFVFPQIESKFGEAHFPN